MDYKAVLEGQIKRLEKKSEELEKRIQAPAEETCMVAKTILELVDAHNKYASSSVSQKQLKHDYGIFIETSTSNKYLTHESEVK